MTNLEKIVAIVTLVIAGAGFYAYFISLSHDVETLKKDKPTISFNIRDNEKSIIDLKSHYEVVNSNIKHNQDLIEYLQNKIDDQQNSLNLSIKITHDLLSEVIKNEK